jgi:hypothetical protein
MTRRWLCRIYSALCGALAIGCLVFAVDGWQTWQRIALTYIIFLVCACVFFAVTSFSGLRGWRLGSWLAGISGAALVLYAISVVLLGWEDVGGARGAIPLALGTGIVGGLGLIIALGGGLERGEVV